MHCSAHPHARGTATSLLCACTSSLLSSRMHLSLSKASVSRTSPPPRTYLLRWAEKYRCSQCSAVHPLLHCITSALVHTAGVTHECTCLLLISWETFLLGNNMLIFAESLSDCVSQRFHVGSACVRRNLFGHVVFQPVQWCNKAEPDELRAHMSNSGIRSGWQHPHPAPSQRVFDELVVLTCCRWAPLPAQLRQPCTAPAWGAITQCFNSDSHSRFHRHKHSGIHHSLTCV